MKATSVCMAWVVLAIGCAGEDLSVGELRCTGDGVRCEPPVSLRPELVGTGTPEPSSPGRAEVVWQRALPCPYGTCLGSPAFNRPGTHLVMHADGSMTVAREIDSANTLDALGVPREAREVGVWLGAFDPEGELLWENDSLIEPAGDVAFRPIVALALDGADRAVLAVKRGGLIPQLTPDGIGIDPRLTLHRIGAEGDLERVFTIEPYDGDLDELAMIDDGVLIAAYHQTESHSSPNPELSRYTEDGELLWRQTGLRHDDYPGQAEVGLTLAPPLTLSAAANGEATLLVPERGGATLVQVAAGGNIHRALSPSTFATLDLSSWRSVLAIDSQQRWVVGQYVRPLVGEDSYAVTRIVADADAVSGFSMELALREREDFHDPLVLGLACDAGDRVLVLTPAGTREAPRLLVDRVSEDFTRRETLVVEGAEDLVPDDDSGAIDNLLEIGGMRVGPDGDLYYWASAEIGRIALP